MSQFEVSFTVLQLSGQITMAQLPFIATPGLGISFSGSHLQKHLLLFFRSLLQSLTGAVPKGQATSRPEDATLGKALVLLPVLTNSVIMTNDRKNAAKATKTIKSDDFFFIYLPR